MSIRHKLDADAAFRVMRLIEKNPRVTQRELANEVGISLGKVHYVLTALLERGYVKLENFGFSENKRAYMYILTPTGLAQKALVAGRFLARKQAEYDALRREIDELRDELTKGVERL